MRASIGALSLTALTAARFAFADFDWKLAQTWNISNVWNQEPKQQDLNYSISFAIDDLNHYIGGPGAISLDPTLEAHATLSWSYSAPPPYGQSFDISVNGVPDLYSSWHIVLQKNEDYALGLAWPESPSADFALMINRSYPVYDGKSVIYGVRANFSLLTNMVELGDANDRLHTYTLNNGSVLVAAQLLYLPSH